MEIRDGILSRAELVELRLREIFAEAGYSRYKMTSFEPYDFYSANKSFIPGRILSFTDTDGTLLALKPDVTLSIIKNYSGGEKRTSYTEKVYRTGSGGGIKEISEAGLERMGSIGLSDEKEVIDLAGRSLSAISDSWILDMAHVGYVSGLMAATEAEDGEKSRLLELLRAKNAAGAAKASCDGASRAVWKRLCEIYGPPEEVIPELKGMALNPEMFGAAAELESISAGANIDFSIVEDMSYYNGAVFKGYIPGAYRAVLSGGRYDNLVKRLGKSAGAIGFAVYLDLVSEERL